MYWIIVFKSLRSKSTWWNEGNHCFGADRNCKLQNVTLAYGCYHGSHSDPTAIIFPELICILILHYIYWLIYWFSVRDTRSSPTELCTLFWQVQAEAQVSQLAAADDASNPGTSVAKRASIKRKKKSELTFACCKPINLYIKPRVNWSDPLITTENQEELKESQDSTEHNKSTPKMLDCFLFPRDFPYKLNINSVSKSQKGSLSPKVDSND